MKLNGLMFVTHPQLILSTSLIHLNAEFPLCESKYCMVLSLHALKLSKASSEKKCALRFGPKMPLIQ